MSPDPIGLPSLQGVAGQGTNPRRGKRYKPLPAKAGYA